MKNKSSFASRCFADYPIICSFIAVLMLSAFGAFSMWRGGEFYYLDTDCYTRYLRITDWLIGDFSWAEKIFPFTNCPHGEVLHFTRINDVLWLIFSLPFFAFLPFKEAIFAGGMIFSPIMFFLILSIIMCSLKKFIGEKNFTAPAPFIFIFAVIFLSKSMILEFGRPDHHSLMLLIVSILISALLNISSKKMFFAGIAAGFGIWASSALEGMLPAYAVLAVLCFGIFFFHHSFEFAWRYTSGLFLGTLFAYVINPPFFGYLYFDNTRLSLIHVVVCGLTCAVFFAGNLLNPKKFSSQFSILFFGMVISVAAVISLFGFETVFAPVYNEKILDYFIPYISEMKPVLPSECPYFIFGSIEVLLLCRLFKLKTFGHIAIYSLFFIFLPFGVLLRRFLSYEILFFVLINSLLLTELFKKISKSKEYRWSAFGLIILNLLFAVSFRYADSPLKAHYPKLQGCALTDIFSAPQLICKTGITTVGSPYHNNVDGISDTVEIFSATDEKEIINKLSERNIKYVIIPNEKLGEKIHYFENLPESSFYKSLQNGQNFDWLNLLNNKNEAILFYEIIR